MDSFMHSISTQKNSSFLKLNFFWNMRCYKNRAVGTDSENTAKMQIYL